MKTLKAQGEIIAVFIAAAILMSALTVASQTNETFIKQGEETQINQSGHPAMLIEIPSPDDGYQPGDQINASIELKKPDGSDLYFHTFSWEFTVDEKKVCGLYSVTDEKGKGYIAFLLPGMGKHCTGILTVSTHFEGTGEVLHKTIALGNLPFSIAKE